jgi:secondary thiamine-phosphate synthase enzyme
MIKTVTVKSRSRSEFINITAEIEDIIRQSGADKDICYIFVPHTTAGITINEGADPAVKRDIIASLDRVFPVDGDYRHDEGNSDAHIKASLTGTSAVVLIEDGKPVLGTWQAIYFCEFDGPRNRQVLVKLI